MIPTMMKVTHQVTLENQGAKIKRLHLWLPKPPETPSQREVEIETVEPPPSNLGREKKYGNEMYYWQLAEDQLEKNRLRFSLQFTGNVYETCFAMPKKLSPRLQQARRLYDWIIDNFEYQYPPKGRSIETTLRTKSGDCGSFAILFAYLCRNEGIDARPVFGFNARSGDYPHAWAEFFLPEYGWIPVDLSRGQKDNRDYYFGNLDNQRLTFSKGTNFDLVPPLPNGKKALFLQSRAIWVEGENYDKIRTKTTLDVEETSEKRRGR